MGNFKMVFPTDCDVYVKDTSNTERQIADSFGVLYTYGVKMTPPSTVAWTAVGTTATQTLSKKTIVNDIETLTASSGGVTPSTMVANGISRIQVATGDPSTSPLLVYLAAPITGVEKTIMFETTAAYINTLDIDLGATVGVGHITGSTTARFIGFSTLATEFQAVTLIGLSTALWGVKTVDSTVGGFGSAAGIRSLTAARTS